jgi:lysozyme
MSVQVQGLDVSHYQGDINWESVKLKGYEFAFIKATEGNDFLDPDFATNWASAKANTVIRGPYHFFHPEISVNEQVEYFLKTIGTLDSGDLAPALDLESPDLWTGLSAENAVDLVIEWCSSVASRLNLTPYIYVSPSFATDILKNNTRLAAYPLWIAEYPEDPSNTEPPALVPWTTWTFWQHTGSGSVTGVGGSNVDLDLFNGSLSELQSLLIA